MSFASDEASARRLAELLALSHVNDHYCSCATVTSTVSRSLAAQRGGSTPTARSIGSVKGWHARRGELRRKLSSTGRAIGYYVTSTGISRSKEITCDLWGADELPRRLAVLTVAEA